MDEDNSVFSKVALSLVVGAIILKASLLNLRNYTIEVNVLVVAVV